MKLVKRPQNPAAYPYLPFEKQTDHFGWSYEFSEEYREWRYFIWYAVNDKTRVCVKTLRSKSRTDAIETCKYYENRWKELNVCSGLEY